MSYLYNLPIDKQTNQRYNNKRKGGICKPATIEADPHKLIVDNIPFIPENLQGD